MTTRRQFLGFSAGAAAGLVGLGPRRFFESGLEAVLAPTGRAPNSAARGQLTGATTSPTAEVNQFFSRPDLHPPRISAVGVASSFTLGGSSGRFLLITPNRSKGAAAGGQSGLMILDGDARMRWFLPTENAPFDLQCQFYKGKQVFTWWQGGVTNGTGAGEAVLADMSFNQIARLTQSGGLTPDLHELTLTNEGTALMTSYHTEAADLSSVGGPTKGYVLASSAMEVDVATGKLAWSWESLDHVPISATYQKFSGGTEQDPFDYFHINSIAVAPDGELIISSRNTWCIYKVSRTTGEVIWRLNGKSSDFAMGEGTPFYWQHHARPHGNGVLSVFDDGAAPAEETVSRGLVLKLDETAMTCTLERAVSHPGVLAVAEGSVQLLNDGGMFVGFGAEPYFSRFSAQGELLVDGHLPTDVTSYRAFVADFATTPTGTPAVAVGSAAKGSRVVYVSWNGATEVLAWRVFAGPTSSALSASATADWADFETAVTVNSAGPYFQVAALDSAGGELARSDVVRAS
ncbi:MAG TPA: arylsulfotransferase family protein [Acidimicrobiales bacterium]|nr:arylsulfotransferase family protein [Acidimicrobiales bacterium]